MHARKTARDALFPSREDDAFFAPRRGDIVFSSSVAVRTFADRVNRTEARSHDKALRPVELGAMALVHEVLHAVIKKYRERHPESFNRLSILLELTLGPDARELVVDFLAKFPPPTVYRALIENDPENTPKKYLERIELTGVPIEMELDEELILLWVTNQNPAYEPVRSIVADHDLGPRYRTFVEEAKKFFDSEPLFGPRGETLLDLLLTPGREHPDSIFAQLGFIDEGWTEALGLDEFGDRMNWLEDFKKEEDKYFQQPGPGPGEPLLESMRFGRREQDEPAQFSPDLNWMPNVVLIAKSVYVWLDQLGKKYGRWIHRLDQIPDEELDLLASRHINGLWLIGLFERSNASRKIKQIHGDGDAMASAYSLGSYDIAAELGGYQAYEGLKQRAWKRGIRLAADMVPNHVGIDGDWVIEHPDWFLQTSTPPFPAYRFGGPDLSSDSRIAVFLEEGYWSRTDAAVVFRRHDRYTGENRFIYHGNDGTSMPWNDTAQIDYKNPEARRAVIETILHVARMFPIIRFDAAMTLAKRHIQRLWYPLPGQAGAIPSRADYAMTQEQFDAAFPAEFWREVVDEVAARAPDTLLLAEAFWMMEGYFVRTLGMHRVYNSAFMNMLKREENEKYTETITNVLDFDAEILKRFVNFMNNPDEETAIAQFGDDDKYFGVACMMCTMPGLPMFGHGQIEGFREKYGMEYRRAKFDERPNEHMVERHNKEIFPILAKRYLFSGVEHFSIYRFVNDFGQVDHDVFAYSNGHGSDRALVLFNNRFKNARGTIFRSTHRRHLADELALDEDGGAWLVMRDLPHGLEYLRTTKDIVDGGMSWELGPYQYHVLTNFRPVNATLEKPYHRLAAELGGSGVPDIEYAVRELYLRPIHAPLREAVSKGHLAYLVEQLDAEDDVAARAALIERLGHVGDGLDWMLTQRVHRDVTVDRNGLHTAGDRFAALHAFVRADRKAAEDALAALADSERDPVTGEKPIPPPPQSKKSFADYENEEEVAPVVTASVLHVDLLLSWIQVEAVLDILASGEAAVEEARSRPPPYLSTMGAMAPIMAIMSPPDSSRDLVAAAAKDEDKDEDETDDDESSPIIPPDEATTETELEPAGSSKALLEPQSSKTLLEPASSKTLLEPTSTPTPIAAASSQEVLITESEPEIAAPPISVPTPSVTTWSAREALLEEWDLATPLVQGFSTSIDPEEAKRRAALVILASTLPSGPLAPALRLALGGRRGQVFMDVHESDGVYWLNKERFEQLVNFLAEREIASGALSPAQAKREADDFASMAEREGYRAQQIASKLGPVPREDTVIRRTSSPDLPSGGSVPAVPPTSPSGDSLTTS